MGVKVSYSLMNQGLRKYNPVVMGGQKEEILIEASHQHPHWDSNKNGKSRLNNLRLLLLPLMCFNLILSWLEVFPIGHLSLGFPRLISLINLAGLALFPLSLEPDFLFSSA